MARRRITRHLARLTVAAATMALLGTGGQVAVSGSTAAADNCDPDQTNSSARVRRGADVEEPSNVSASEAKAIEKTLDRKVARMMKNGRLNAKGTRTRPITIRTYVHVITRADTTGGVTAQQIADQMQVINDGYAGLTSPNAAATPFRFVLADTDYTANDDWYNWSVYTDNDDDEAKAALHEGGWTDLNIYIAGLEDGLLGYAYFPEPDLPLYLDGLVLLNESLPGGSAAPYNLGDTATHEIGHWLGLYHTFENGCVAPGDFVDDTPYQHDGDNIFYCNESDNTCPDRGRDPVHNFMSYGDDPCLNQFTQGQSDRQVQTWLAFRAKTVNPPR